MNGVLHILIGSLGAANAMLSQRLGSARRIKS